MTTRRELIEAVGARYRGAGRDQKKEILDEFVKVTGFHRKHAIRVLKESPRLKSGEPRQRARIYDEAVRQALTDVYKRQAVGVPPMRGTVKSRGHSWTSRMNTMFDPSGV